MENLYPCIIDIGPFDEEGAKYLKAQRSWLSSQPSCDEVEGLMNFMDHIADQLHNRYGYDTLFTEGDNDA